LPLALALAPVLTDVQELLHRSLGRVRPEGGLLADPRSALAGNGPLVELVAQLDLELGAVEGALPGGLRNEALLALFAQPISHLVRHEGWRREDELQALNLSQLRLQRLERIDRERGRSDLETRPPVDGGLEVVAEEVGGVVDNFHGAAPLAPALADRG